jgi:DNA primase
LDFGCNLPSVGVPGVNNWKKHYTKLLADFDKVFMFADGDQAGHEFSKSLTRELGNVVTIQMPDGEDVNSIFLKKGAEFFTQKIESSR